MSRFKLADRATKMLAFLSYYTVRYEHKAKGASRKLDFLLSERKIIAERAIEQQKGMEYATPDAVSWTVWASEDVHKKREVVDKLRFKADVLKAIRDAYRERSWTLRTQMSADRIQSAE